jgi:hypothetical protein
MKRLQDGFSAPELILIVVVVAIISLVGWRVWDASQAPASTADTSNPVQKDDAPAINNEADLDEVSKELENADVGDAYETELNSQTNF